MRDEGQWLRLLMPSGALSHCHGYFGGACWHRSRAFRIRCPGNRFETEIVNGVTDMFMQSIARRAIFELVRLCGAAAMSQQALSFAIVPVEALDRRGGAFQRANAPKPLSEGAC